MKYRLLIALFLFVGSFAKAQIVINEFSSSNTTNFGGGNDDWLELYNTSAAAINIGGYYLSDKLTNPIKWQIPVGTTIAANGYFTVLLSGNNVTTGATLETNFKLTQMDQEWVVLANTSGTVEDSYQMLEPTPGGHSRGRISDGSLSWGYFSTPTPNASNTSIAYTDYAQKPVFSIAPGFYPSAQSVSLTCATAATQIRYTTDGSIPSATSNLYASPINVSTTTIIRAQAYPTAGSGLLPSLIENNTYFINVTHTVPVISVSGNYGAVTTGNGTFSPLNSAPNGIFSSIEYFDVNQQFQWESMGDMRRHGNDSWAYPQKGIRFHSQDRYGYASTIAYPLMQRSNRQKYDVIILKAGASDNYPTGAGGSTSAHIRDAFVQSFAEKNGIDVDTRRYEPCVLYVNGQYWGVYEIRERVDTDYTDFYYNQPDDKVDMVRVWGGVIIDAGSDTAWFNLRDFIVNNNMAIPANYQHVADRLDVNSFIDYFIYNQFLVNTDVFNWNTHWWRGRKNAGVKWRFVLWDMDNTFGLGQNYSGLPDGTDCNSSPCGYEAPGSNVNNISQVQMFADLKQNPIFLQTYANRYAYLNNHVLTCEKLLPHLDSLINRITPEFPGQVARWGGTIPEWEAHVQGIRDFINCRCANILTSLVDCNPSLQGPYEACISSLPANVGVITFDSTTVTTTENCFTYFGGVDIPITAISNNPNYEFDYWELPNGTVINVANIMPSALIQLVDSGLIIAHFKPAINLSKDTSICIGESVQLHVSGGATYSWVDIASPTVIVSVQPDVLVSPSQTTFYKVSTNIGSDSVKVTVKPLPIVNLGADSLKLCEGDTLQKFIYLANAHYLWNDGDTNYIKRFTLDGIYTVQLTLEGCINSDTVEYKFYEFPVVELGNDTLLCQGEELLLNASSDSTFTYLWSTGDTSQTLLVQQQDEYIVKANKHYCATFDTIHVNYEICIPCRAYIPDAITPNDDKNNDSFLVTFRDDKDCKLKSFHLEIYNRWGETVFVSNNIAKAWIPPTNSNLNIYGYLLTYALEDRGEYNTIYSSGSITVIK